ncbi:MAG TPA: hypothetical protein VLB68_19025 [Pyrinomonadaceae bacterium]|nr:hypothetical protein [Pyrinomonadaceae bacterium]
MKLSIKFCSSLVLALVCVLLGAQTTASAAVNPQGKEAVRILALTSGKNTVDLDHPFANGDDWLSDFKIRLKNVSDKTVVYVEIKFNFTEASDAGNELSFTIELGNKPGGAATKASMALKPHKAKNYLLNKTEYRALAAFVKERRKASQLDKVEVKVGSVLFAG